MSFPKLEVFGDEAPICPMCRGEDTLVHGVRLDYKLMMNPELGYVESFDWSLWRCRSDGLVVELVRKTKLKEVVENE